MIQISLARRIVGSILGVWMTLLAGCTPVYLWDTNTTSTPRPQSFDVATPVATFGLLAPASLQGFSPFLSRALMAAISEASPSMRGIPSNETVSVINGQGLAEEYADLIAGFIRSGILERERLQRIGSALGARYVLLPGLADFNQVVIDKFEIAGIKMLRNRVITLRLWLQLWDTATGEIIWESAGEATVASELLMPQRMVPLDEIGQKLWLRMVQDNLLTGETQARFFNN